MTYSPWHVPGPTRHLFSTKDMDPPSLRSGWLRGVFGIQTTGRTSTVSHKGFHVQTVRVRRYTLGIVGVLQKPYFSRRNHPVVSGESHTGDVWRGPCRGPYGRVHRIWVRSCFWTVYGLGRSEGKNCNKRKGPYWRGKGRVGWRKDTQWNKKLFIELSRREPLTRGVGIGMKGWTFYFVCLRILIRLGWIINYWVVRENLRRQKFPHRGL